MFEGPHDQERWDVRARHGDVRVARYQFREPEDTNDGASAPAAEKAKSEEPGRTGEQLVMLLLRREREVEPVNIQYRPRQGDLVSLAMHRHEEREAAAWLESRGWREAPSPAEPVTGKTSS